MEYPIITTVPMTPEFIKQREENLKNVIWFKREWRREWNTIIIETIPIYK